MFFLYLHFWALFFLIFESYFPNFSFFFLFLNICFQHHTFFFLPIFHFFSYVFPIIPQADGAFKIQCLLSVPFLFQLRTQQQQLQLLTYTHGIWYRCNTIRRLAVDPHIFTVTFLIKCGRLCLCFVLVLFPNVKLWFILVWQSFFFLFEFWNPFFPISESYFFLFFFRKINIYRTNRNSNSSTS